VIRINLLPQKKKKRVEAGPGGELWLLAAIGVLLVEIALLFVLQSFKEDELAKHMQTNAQIQSQIDQAKKAVANQDEVKKELERMRSREDAIAKLQSARSGPTAVLLELSRILTPGRGPSVNPEKLAQLRRDNPLAVHNPTWDTRRLWITKYVEETRHMKLEGIARDGEDVSEFARRLNLSDYFHKVTLLPASRVKDKTGLDVIGFALEAEVRY
jgi:type IV pilus assembly protein PilN